MKAAADGDSAAPAKKRPKVTFKSREFVDTEDEDVEVAPSERRGSDGRGEKARADTPSDQEDWEESEESEESEDLEELIKAKKVSELGSASGKFFFFPTRTYFTAVRCLQDSSNELCVQQKGTIQEAGLYAVRQGEDTMQGGRQVFLNHVYINSLNLTSQGSPTFAVYGESQRCMASQQEMRAMTC